MIKAAQQNRISQLFANRSKSDKVMSLFITAGYPDLDATVDLILGMEANGAELIELGMPFSDPLADGPTIQYASNQAIANGITMNHIFEIVRQVRQQSSIPIVLMGYLNPIMRYGMEQFCADTTAAGVDGLIIPDLPPEERALIKKHDTAEALALIFLVAPNTSDERMRFIDDHSAGFVYCVSVTGVTGARDGNEVSQSVNRFIQRVNNNIKMHPVMVGFGIKSHEDAALIADQMNGFIVGSALIDTIRTHYPADGWQEAVFNFVHQLKHGEVG